MSFRKYGGTNKLEKNNNLTVHSIVADTFTIRNAFLSVFTIDGDLKINGNAVISDILTVKQQINVSTLDVSSNAIIEGYLYLDKFQEIFLKGNDNMIGINTETPNATLDISSNKVQAFNLKTSTVNNRNIIARNASNNGIAVVTKGTTESGIQFYSASTGTIDVSNAQGAIIKYSNANGILTIDASGTINVTSKMILSDNTSTGTTHTAFGETLLLYDKNTGSNPIFLNESYGNASVKTGSALTIKSINNASNTFMNIVTPDNNLGVQIGGGSFPKDPTRSMGVIDVYHTGVDVDATPAMMIVSGNTFTKYNSTTGFNTFAPKYNDYAVDINGPLHLNNGEIKKTADVTFRVAKMGNFGSLYGMAIGAQGTDNTPVTHYPFVTTDGGKNWIKINTFYSSTTTTLIPENVIFKTIQCYSKTRTIVCGTQNVDPQNFAYVLDNDIWSKLTIDMVQVNAIYASDVSKNFLYSGGKSDSYGNAIIRGGSIFSYSSSGPQYAYSDRDPSFNYPMPNTTITSMAGYGGNLIVVGGNKLHKFDMGVGKMSLVTPPTTTTDSVGNVYLSVRLADANNGVAVGGNIISYTRNGGASWYPANIPSMGGKIFNDVYLDSSMNAIVVGNSGYIYSSNDNYTTWKIVSEDVLNASGIGARITDQTNDITSVFMTDSSTIVLSIVKNNTPNDKVSKLYYLNMPNIFNNKQNFLFDISGCVRMSGDMYINDGGSLKSNNQTFNLLTTNVTTLNVGTSAIALNLGGTNSTTIDVGGLNTTNLTMGGANVTIGGISSGNILIGGKNTANVFIGGANTGNIIIGGSGSGSIFGSLNVSALSVGNVTLANNLKTGNIYANSIVVNNNLQVSNGTLTVSSTSNSMSATTGSLVVYGGLGVTKDIYTSGSITTSGNITLSGNLNSTGNTLLMTSIDDLDITYSTGARTITYTENTGSMRISGGSVISKKLYVKSDTYCGGDLIMYGQIKYLNSSVSTSTTFDSGIVASPLRGNSNSNVNYSYTYSASINPALYNNIGFNSGALTTEGGFAVALDSWLIGNLRVDGTNNIISRTVESISATTGALQIRGGVGIGWNTHVGGNVIVYSSIESTSANTGALQIRGGVGISNNTNVGGNVIIYSSIESTSTNTGALQIIGGVGIGSNANILGNIRIFSSIESISATTGALQIIGGVGIRGNTNIGGNVIIYSSVESISATTGALQIIGGVGIRGNTNIGGNVIIYSSVESISATTGALQIIGGVGIRGNTNIGGNVIIYSSIESISATTGAIQIIGGAGIRSNANIGGNVIIYSSIESISATTGALQIRGGVGISRNTNIGGNVIIYSSIESISATTGALQIIGGVGIRGNTNIGGNVIIYSSIESISATTGALQIIGGVGIARNTNIGGNLIINSTIPSLSATTGALQVIGGVGIGGNLYITRNTNIGGSMIVNDLTDTISATAGALQVKGGIGVSGNIVSNGTLYSTTAIVSGALRASDLRLSTSTVTTGPGVGALVLELGGIGLAGSIHAGGNVIIYSSIPSSSTATGALQVRGGLGIGGDINGSSTTVVTVNSIYTNFLTASRPIIILDSTESSSLSTGALKVSNGGLAVQGNIIVGGNILIQSSIESISATTGALQIIGGVGIRGNTYHGGNVIISSSIESISATTGALQIIGGVGIRGNTNIGGNVVLYSTIATLSATTGALQVKGGMGIIGDIQGSSTTVVTVNSIYTNFFTASRPIIILDSTESSSLSTGALKVSNGGLAVQGNIIVGGNILIQSSIESISATTGALQIIGGIGIRGNTNIGGNVIISSSIESVSATTGALQVMGGVGIGKNVYIGGGLTVAGTITSLLSSASSLLATTITGGLSITGGSLNVGTGTTLGGTLNVVGGSSLTTTTITGGLAVTGTNINYSTQDSGGTIAGALQVLGGAGIGKNVYIGGSLTVAGTITSSGASAGSLLATTITGGLAITGGSLNVGTGTTLGGTLNVVGNANLTNISYTGSIITLSTNTNLSIGYRTLSNTTTGTNNTGFGNSAIKFNTTGNRNTAFGGNALLLNTTPSDNVAIGYNALYSGNRGELTAVGSGAMEFATGDFNTALGFQTLRGAGTTNTGSNNTAIGYQAMFNSATSANRNTAIGKDALYGVGGTVTGTDNVAIGYQPSYSLTTGTKNIAIGSQCSLYNKEGSENIALGFEACLFNTGGGQLVVVGNGAFRLGYGSNNTALGYQALKGTGGHYGFSNTAVGHNAFTNIGSGSFNTGLGAATGQSLTTGSFNTIIGALAQPSSASVTNEITIGHTGTGTLRINTSSATFDSTNVIVTSTAASITASTGALQVRGGLGVNGSIFAGGTVTAPVFNATSDRRIKKDITDISFSTLELMRKIRPREYTMIDGSKESVYGFIAQEVKEVIPKSIYLKKGYIPSVYENAFVNDNRITLINKSTTDISNCKLKLRDRNNNDIIVDILKIIDDKSFYINHNISQSISCMDVCGNYLDKRFVNGKITFMRGLQVYTGEIKLGIFVYGIQVHDFHTVNKDTIWTITLGATQEMDVQLQEARHTIKSLEERISAIERRLT